METLPIVPKQGNISNSHHRKTLEDEKLIPIHEVRKLRKKVELVPEWKSKGKYNTNTPYEQGFQTAIDILLKEINDYTNNDWEFICTKKDVDIKRKVRNLADPAQFSVKGTGIINSPPKLILDLVTAHRRTEWDELCRESRIIEKIDEYTEIHHDFFQATKCLIKIPRELLFGVRVHEIDGGGYIVEAHAVDHPKCPITEEYVRMNLWPSGWVIEPWKKDASEEITSSRVTYIVQLDLKVAFVPSAFINMVSIGQPLNVNKLRIILENDRLEKEKLEELALNKQRQRDVKFEDLLSCFESEEKCINFILHKFGSRNPQVLAKAIEMLHPSSEGLSEDEITKQLKERGRTRGASFSNLFFAIHSAKGDRETLEDTNRMVKFTGCNDECYLFAVFDGHFGIDASFFCEQHFHEEFINNLHSLNNDPRKALETTFQVIEDRFIKDATAKRTEAGTTAVIAILFGTQLIIGNVGDSEAVLYRHQKPIVLTEIHSPKNPNERSRVKDAGGTIHGNKLCHPVWNPSVINLGVTRAIGDVYFKLGKFAEGKPTGLIAKPTIRETIISAGDEFLVIGSDGLWQALKYEEVMEFVFVHLKEFKVETVVKKLVEYALSKDSSDNITVIIITF